MASDMFRAPRLRLALRTIPRFVKPLDCGSATFGSCVPQKLHFIKALGLLFSAGFHGMRWKHVPSFGIHEWFWRCWFGEFLSGNKSQLFFGPWPPLKHVKQRSFRDPVGTSGAQWLDAVSRPYHVSWYCIHSSWLNYEA